MHGYKNLTSKLTDIKPTSAAPGTTSFASTQLAPNPSQCPGMGLWMIREIINTPCPCPLVFHLTKQFYLLKPGIPLRTLGMFCAPPVLIASYSFLTVASSLFLSCYKGMLPF